MRLIALISTLLIAQFALAQGTTEQPDRNSDMYNLVDDSIGLKGYDPVSYFPEGGEEPAEGNEDIAVTYGGVTYHFVSEANRDAFNENPTKFEPTYGGWCAYAMAFDSQVDINPSHYVIDGNRAHFFVSRRAKNRFKRDAENLEQRADGNWKDRSGEEPRK